MTALELQQMAKFSLDKKHNWNNGQLYMLRAAVLQYNTCHLFVHECETWSVTFKTNVVKLRP